MRNIYRQHQGIFGLPSQSQSLVNTVRVFTQTSSPLLHGMSFVTHSYPLAIPSIIRLLNIIRPFTVSGPAFFYAFITMSARVIAIVINTVNRISSFWPFTHINGKTVKLMPTVAYPNTSSPIFMKSRGVLHFTTANHLVPNIVKRVQCVVSGIFTATTAKGFTIRQYLRGAINESAAKTLTQPLARFISETNVTFDGQQVDYQASHLPNARRLGYAFS
jgi:hypothetical protein